SLWLLARRRFHADRAQLRDTLRPPNVGDRPLDRARTDGETALAEQALDDHGIATRRPRVQRARLIPPCVRQPPRRRSSMMPRLHPLADIAPNRIDRNADCPRNCLLAH